MAYSAELYVHDLDRQAADALNQFPKFVKLLESYSANYDEKAAKIDLLSTAIRLGENQMPEVYGLLPPICEQLGIDTPELYYGKNVDRKEFLKQALDLKSFVNDSKSNKLMELMLVQDETHPRLATRAYECYEWSRSAQYAGIIDGTFTLPDKTKEINQELAEDVASFRLAQPAQTRIKPGLFKNLKTIKHLYNHT